MCVCVCVCLCVCVCVFMCVCVCVCVCVCFCVCVCVCVYVCVCVHVYTPELATHGLAQMHDLLSFFSRMLDSARRDWVTEAVSICNKSFTPPFIFGLQLHPDIFAFSQYVA
jgi:hypothetical protein